MPTPAQFNRWRARHAKGWSIRRIAEAETRPKVSRSTVHRALTLPVRLDARRRPYVDIGTLERCMRISSNIQSIHAPSAARLRNLHNGMLAADVTRILKEVQRDVVKALGF